MKSKERLSQMSKQQQKEEQERRSYVRKLMEKYES